MNNLSIFNFRTEPAPAPPSSELMPPEVSQSGPGLPYDLHDDRYANVGYQQAIENRANADNYQLILNHLLRNAEAETHDIRALNARKRSEVEDELAVQQSERKQLSSETLPLLQKQLEEKQHRHDEVARDPASLSVVEPTYDAAKAQLMKTGLLLLSLFLYVFYFLTGHAAFLKNVGEALEGATGSDVSVLFETVFDAASVLRDLAATPFNILLCALFPVVFFATGYLVHHYLKEKQYGKMACTVAVTVALDISIAYKVTSKMFDARRLAGLEEQHWHVSMILADVNFYLILLAGMAVYVLWGVLLGLYLEERKRGDRVAVFLEGCCAEMAALEKEIARTQERIAALDASSRESRNRLARLEEPGTLTLFSWRQIEQILDSFTSGWSRGVERYYQTEQDRLEREKRQHTGELLTMLTSYKTALKSDFRTT